jgi:acyl carrier protein
MTIHTTDPLFDSLQHLLSDYTDPKDVTREASLKEDLGLDSLDILDFGFNVELEYDITVGNDDITRWNTVADVLNFITANQPD